MNVRVGADTTIHPMTVVYDDCFIGKRCIIHGGVVIGSDGFGFAPDFSSSGGQWVKIPQTGRVIIGDDVECGASMTIDRGAMSDTLIGDGCKFDNQVQIGHNVKVGAHTVMAGCSGIAGSTEVGSLCIIGGYTNFSGHLKIADRTTVSGGTSVTKSITTSGKHFTGVFPFTEHAQWEKNAAILRGIDKLRQQIKSIIKK
jgi:UDP-3-O-[3-hydroxymyristoyl] glucosamine N-acyltransferase